MNRRRGAILILVLFVMVILSLLAVSFTYRAGLKRRSAMEGAVAIRLRRGANSAVAIAMARLAAETNAFDHPAEPWCAHAPLSLDGWLEEWSFRGGGGEADYQADYQVCDADGKLNVSLASGEALRKLSMKDEQIAGLLDWMDSDDVARSEGAESAYYESLPRPYRCKDAPLEWLEELRLVRGFGSRDGEGEPLGAEGVGRADWADLLTCLGDGRINLNTAPVEVLRTLPISDQAVGQIVGYRAFDSDSGGSLESHVFAAPEDIQQLQGLTSAERDVLLLVGKFRSDYFRILAFCRHRVTGLEYRLEVWVRSRAGQRPEVVEWKRAG